LIENLDEVPESLEGLDRLLSERLLSPSRRGRPGLTWKAASRKTAEGIGGLPERVRLTTIARNCQWASACGTFHLLASEVRLGGETLDQHTLATFVNATMSLEFPNTRASRTHEVRA
jgi:hypothetical protein